VQASPGNLAQFEDLLYGSAETTSSAGIMAVRFASDHNQLVRHTIWDRNNHDTNVFD